MKIDFAEVGILIVRMHSPKVGFSLPNADFACCCCNLDNSLMEVAFVIVQKTDSMTAVDFVVVLKIDFAKVCFVSVWSDSAEVHSVKLTGSATVVYVVAKADFAIMGLGTAVDSEKLVLSNARRFESGRSLF